MTEIESCYSKPNFFLDLVIDQLTDNCYTIKQQFIPTDLPLPNLNCVFLVSKEDEIPYTFDKSNKIQIVIPKSVMTAKMMNSSTPYTEMLFHEYQVNLIDPKLDFKIGYDKNAGDFYGNFVLLVEKYEKIAKEGKEVFGSSILQQVRYEEMKFVDQDEKALPFYSDFFNEILNVNEIERFLQANNYFDLRNKEQFFEKFELLLFSQVEIEKSKMSHCVYKNAENNKTFIANNNIVTQENNDNKVNNTYDSQFNEMSRMSMHNFKGTAQSEHKTISQNRFDNKTMIDYSKSKDNSSIFKTPLNRLNFDDLIEDNISNENYNQNEEPYFGGNNNVNREEYNFTNHLKNLNIGTTISCNKGQFEAGKEITVEDLPMNVKEFFEAKSRIMNTMTKEYCQRYIYTADFVRIKLSKNKSENIHNYIYKI